MAMSCCSHFNEIIKKPGTSFQIPAFSQKHTKNVCHTATSI